MMFVMNHRTIGAAFVCLAVVVAPGAASADPPPAPPAAPQGSPLVFAQVMAALAETCRLPETERAALHLPPSVQNYCNGTVTVPPDSDLSGLVSRDIPRTIRPVETGSRASSSDSEHPLELGVTGSVTDIILRGLTQFLWSRVRVEAQRIVHEALRGLLSPPAAGSGQPGTDLFGRIRNEPCAVLPATCSLLGFDPDGHWAAPNDTPIEGASTSTSDPSAVQALAALGEALRNALARDVVTLPRNLDRVIRPAPGSAARAEEEPVRLLLGLGLAISDGAGPGQVVAALRERLPAVGASPDRWVDLRGALDVIEVISLAQNSRRQGDITDFGNSELAELVARMLAAAPRDPDAQARALLLLRELDRTLASVHQAAESIGDTTLNDAERAARVLPLVRGMVTAIRTGIQFDTTLRRRPPSTDDGVDRLLRGLSDLPEIYDALARRDLPRFLATTLSTIERILPTTNRSRSFSTNVRKVLVFAAELASASDADAAMRVFETLALPAGSWEMQTRQPSTTLSAYVGLGGGGSLDLVDADCSSGFFQPVAMIGVDRTTPIQTSRGWFYGYFISVVDVGALLSPFEPRGTGRPLTERPLRMLSPGVYGHINYRAISFMGGASIMPFSRDEEWSPTFRLMGAVSFGFPLFAL